VPFQTGIDRLIKLSITAQKSNWQLTDMWEYPVVEANNFGIKGYLVTSSGNIAVTNFSSAYEGASAYIIAEYTKT
jgi:hypothetical protein